MIPFTKFLDEARRNPNHPSQQRLAPKEQLEKYSASKDIFITYTLEDKVGVNPKSKHPYEPAGVYTYPLDVVIDDLRKNNIRNVPFAGKRANFVYVLQLTTNSVLDCEKYTKSQLTTDLNKLESMYPEHVKEILYFYENGTASPDIDENEFRIWKIADTGDAWFRGKYESFHKYGTQYPFLKLKTIIKDMAAVLMMSKTSKKIRNPNSFITSMFRKLGYEVLVDRLAGIGLIHKSEPQQAVFLSPKGYKVIDKIDLASVPKSSEDETVTIGYDD